MPREQEQESPRLDGRRSSERDGPLTGSDVNSRSDLARRPSHGCRNTAGDPTSRGPEPYPNPSRPLLPFLLVLEGVSNHHPVIER